MTLEKLTDDLRGYDYIRIYVNVSSNDTKRYIPIIEEFACNAHGCMTSDLLDATVEKVEEVRDRNKEIETPALIKIYVDCKNN